MYTNLKAVNLESEYAPSEHSQRPNVIANFIKVCKAATERAQTKYNTRQNIRYGSDNTADRQLLDIYYKGAEEATPIFVFIHGGFWQELDKSTGGSFVELLVAAGYRVVVVDYNLCPQVTLEQLCKEMTQFYHWLMAYAKTTAASHISICGHSAGAHLATLLFSMQPTELEYVAHLTSMFLISGIYDLRELWQLNTANAQNILALDDKKAAKLSTILWQEHKQWRNIFPDLKIHVLVAEHDSNTFIGQTWEYCKFLKANGFLTEYKMFAGYDHFDIIEKGERADTEISQYILENVKIN